MERKNNKELVGLIPAAGQAVRLSPLPFSKELYPIGFRQVDDMGSLRPKVVCHYLLEKMRIAGVTRAYIVLRNGKWDIPAYLGDGRIMDMYLAYVMMGLPFGPPYTLDQAHPFIKDSTVVFGFPDILFQPDDAYVSLLKRLGQTKADIVLGVFPADLSGKWESVSLDDTGRISCLTANVKRTKNYLTWAIAVWTPVFTNFLHNYLAAIQKSREVGKIGGDDPEQRELSVGDAIQAAVKGNLHVEGVLFPEHSCIDIGTSDDLKKVTRKMS